MKAKEVLEYRHRCVDIYKITQGCVVCGYNEHPSNLCFDHLPGHEKAEVCKNGYSKRSTAGGMYKLYSKKYTIEELIGEMKKCRVICHHCHMKNHHKKNKRTIDKVKERINSIEELEKLLTEFEKK